MDRVPVLELCSVHGANCVLVCTSTGTRSTLYWDPYQMFQYIMLQTRSFNHHPQWLPFYPAQIISTG